MSRTLIPIILFLLALCLRLLYIWQIKDSPLVDVLLIDSSTYDELARRILEGRYQGEETYAVNILYPWFLAGIYSVFKTATLPVLFVQAVLDAFSCVLVFWLGKRLFNGRTGVLAGVLTAVFGPMIFYSGSLLTPTLITFLGMIVVVLLVQYGSRPAWYLALSSGLVAGLATLARGNNLLLVGAGLLYFASLHRSWKRALQPTAWMLVGAVGIIGFVNVRNFLVEKHFVPVSANYAAFYIGHNDDATGLYVLPDLVETASFEGEVWGMRDAVSEMAGRRLTLAESAQYLFRAGVGYAITNPGREVELAARKFYYFWNRTESPTNLNYHFARDFSWLLRFLPLTFGIIAPFALFGMWLTRREWRRYVVLYLYVAIPLITSLLFFFSAEYRLAVVPVFLVFASHGVMVLVSEVSGLFKPTKQPVVKSKDRGRTRRSKPAKSTSLWSRPLLQAVVFLPLLFVFSNVRTSLLAAQTLKRVDYLNFGTLYRMQGELDRAEQLLRQSIAIDRRFGPAYTALSEVYRLRGDQLEAARLAQLGRRYQLPGQYQTDPDPRAPLADSILVMAESYRAGDVQSALAGYQRLALMPEARSDIGLGLSIQNNIGLCYYKLGQLPEAEAVYREILSRDSSYVKGYTNLGLVLEASGRVEEATHMYLRALELDPQNQSARRRLERLATSD